MDGLALRRMKFWGWGFEGENATAEERDWVLRFARERFGVEESDTTPPREDEIDLPKPRVTPPASLQRFCSTARIDRLVHAYGKSFVDSVRAFER